MFIDLSNIVHISICIWPLPHTISCLLYRWPKYLVHALEITFLVSCDRFHIEIAAPLRLISWPSQYCQYITFRAKSAIFRPKIPKMRHSIFELVTSLFDFFHHKCSFAI